jgi:hypothetical protein
MEKTEIRQEVLRVLREEAQTHVNAIDARIRERREDYTRGDALRLQEVIWDLLVQGVLAPGKNSLNLHLPFLHLTTYGARCVEEATVLLHDPTEYLHRLEGSAGEEIIAAVHEAMQCFLAGRPAAAIALLGGAAERLVDGLAEAAGNRLEGRTRGTFRARLTRAGRDAVRRASIVVDVLLDSRLPEPIRASAEVHVGDLIGLLRLSRDERGLPLTRAIDLERAHAALLTFPATVRWCQEVAGALQHESA